MNTSSLQFDIADQPLSYSGREDSLRFNRNLITEFNHRHRDVLSLYDITLKDCTIIKLEDNINRGSNLGAFRNLQLRQSIILSAALSAVAVSLHGRGSLNKFPGDQATAEKINDLKRANDRTAAQVMAEVLQITTDSLLEGDEVIIESTITEGARIKPGKEVGGNPTIAIGAIFGKKQHQARYGIDIPPSVTRLAMGSDVVEGTTKSVKGLHSSFTALFVTQSPVKRHLPDIYVQRWMGRGYFPTFNPREVSLIDSARIISRAGGHSSIEECSAFFLDRPRHYMAMQQLNQIGISTPYDADGDLFPAVIMGMEGLGFPNGRGLSSMIGEIGGSAEWAVGVLPLVWRGGQAIGMLTSHSSLARPDLDPSYQWKERFHFTEEEFMLIQDARLIRKPYFTIEDIIADPFAGGVSAFGAITDNYYLPVLKGVLIEPEQAHFSVNVLTVNSLGTVKCWRMTFKCNNSLEHSSQLFQSPKEQLMPLSGKNLEKRIGEMLDNYDLRRRFLLFFKNEYYPGLIPVHDKVILLHKGIAALKKRGALNDKDSEILTMTERLAGDWFFYSD